MKSVMAAVDGSTCAGPMMAEICGITPGEYGISQKMSA
jgi:hypothetical protein